MLYFFAVQFAALCSKEDFKSVVVSLSPCHDDETDENKRDWIPLILRVSDQLHFMAQSWSHYPTDIVQSHEVARVRLTRQLRVILKIREKERGIIGVSPLWAQFALQLLCFITFPQGAFHLSEVEDLCRILTDSEFHVALGFINTRINLYTVIQCHACQRSQTSYHLLDQVQRNLSSDSIWQLRPVSKFA